MSNTRIIHKRTFVVAAAACDIGEVIAKKAIAHKLTYLELIGILAEQLGLATKYALRAERHPEDPDQPAG